MRVVATSLRELIVSVSADTTKYQREMDRASRMGAQYFRSVREGGADANRAWNAQTAAARTHATAIEASSQAIGRYAAVAAAAFSVGTLVGMADDWGQISARIKLATQTQDEFTLAQSRLMEIANRTYRDYTEAADQFAGTAQSMREMGFAASETLDAAEVLGLALVAGGSNAKRGASANDAWAKSMVQGRIATDQFQTLLLQTPRVVQALGEGLGKTTAELQAMAQEGKLTAQVVVPAITSQIGKLRDEVEAMPTTVQDAGTRFRNELRAWVGGQNEAFGATQVLVGGIEAVTENLNGLITIGGGAALGAMAGKMILMATSTAQAALSFVQSRTAAIAEAVAVRDATLQAQLKAQADVRRAQAAMVATRGTTDSARQSRNLAAALLAERQATLAAAQAQTAYGRATNLTATAGRAALGFLGGPAGLAITVGLAAAGWLAFSDNTDSASQALDNWSGSADEAIAKFRELNKEQQAGAILRLEEEIGKSAESIRESLDSMFGTANQEIGSNFAGPYREAILGLQKDFDGGRLSADQFSARLADLNTELLDGKPAGDRLRETYIKFTDTIATAARETERKRSILGSFNSTNAEAQTQANASAGAIRQQAGALDGLGVAADAAGKKIQSALSSLPGQIERIGKSATQVATLDVRDWVSGAGTPTDMTARLAQGMEYVRLIDEQEKAQKRYADATKAVSAATGEAKRKAEEARREAERQIETYNDLVAAQERQIALFGSTSNAAEVAYDSMHGALAKYSDAQKEVIAENAKWLDWLDEMADIQRVWDDAAKAQEEYGKKASTQFDALTATADQAARNIQSYLGDSMFNILDGKFTDIGDSFEQMIKRMLSELAASQLLSALGGAMSSYGGAGGFGNFIRGVGGSITKGAGKAAGGLAQPRTMMPVAEHGPELLQVGGQTMLMMGAQRGLVSPLMQKQGSGGAAIGSALQVVINNNGDSRVSARQEQGTGPDGLAMRKIVIDIIADDIASGGRTGQAGKGRYGWQEAL